MGLEFGDVFVKQKEILEAALSTSAEMQEKLRKIIRVEVKAARDAMADRARGAMNEDPRGAAQAVRHSIYKSVLGGQINIFNGKSGGDSSSYTKPRKLDQTPNQRGGNRRPRSARTEQVDGYGPGQRGFILRFLNSGTTPERQTRYGNRGGIAAQNWFRTAGDAELNAAVERIIAAIEAEIALF